MRNHIEEVLKCMGLLIFVSFKGVTIGSYIHDITRPHSKTKESIYFFGLHIVFNQPL